MQDIKVLVEKKTELERKKERLLGKMESAKNTLSELDSRLIAMNIKPNELDEEIQKLTELFKRYNFNPTIQLNSKHYKIVKLI